MITDLTSILYEPMKFELPVEQIFKVCIVAILVYVMVVLFIWLDFKISTSKYLPLMCSGNSEKQITYTLRILDNLYSLYKLKGVKKLHDYIFNNYTHHYELNDEVICVVNVILKNFFISYKTLDNACNKIMHLL